jgi:hypothetical protein
LAAYITDRQLQVQVDGLGGLISKENLSDEGNAYAVLSPGERGSTSADRAAFLAAIGIQNQIIITRIDSVVQAIGQSVDDKGEKIVTINQVLQSERLCRQFKNVTTENDRAIEVDATMVSFNSGGHFNLVLSECDVTLMQAEINQRQENFIKAGKLQEKSEPSMIAQAIQDNDEYEGEKKHKTDKPADSVVQTAVKKDDNDESSAILSFVLRYPKAVKSILVGLAAAVVTICLASAASLAIMPAVGLVAASALITSTLTFFLSKPVAKLDAEESELQPELIV